MIMKRWFETQGYELCFRLAVMRTDHGQPWGWLEGLWSGIWYRYYCPYPKQGNWRARACADADCCGCSNLDRYGTPERIVTVRDWQES
jgi:hypothetical protein